MSRRELSASVAETHKSRPVRTLAGDVLHGFSQIAEFIDETPRRTRYLATAGQIPAFKVGRFWRMRRSTYLALIAQREAQALNGNAHD
jgi:hypothetical protein